MKVVPVVVQCIRQYTESSPGCNMLEAGGNTLHSAGNPFLPDEM